MFLIEISLYSCSHLDPIVTYKIIDKDARKFTEAIEEASGSRRES